MLETPAHEILEVRRAGRRRRPRPARRRARRASTTARLRVVDGLLDEPEGLSARCASTSSRCSRRPSTGISPGAHPRRRGARATSSRSRTTATTRRSAHLQVDDTPYGGGAGMVLRIDVVCAALEAVFGGDAERVKDGRRVVELTPKGRQLDDALAAELAGGDLVAALRPLRGHRRARDAIWSPTASPSAPTCSPAARWRPWPCSTPSCASCPARSATRRAWSASRTRRARGRGGVPAVHAPGGVPRLGGARGAAQRRPRRHRRWRAEQVEKAVRYRFVAGRRRRVLRRPARLLDYPPVFCEKRLREHHREHRAPAAARRHPAVQGRRHRQGPLQGRRGHPPAHPGLPGHRHQAPGPGRARDLHRAQAVLRRRRRAHVPRALAQDRQDRGDCRSATCAAPSCTTCARRSASRPASARSSADQPRPRRPSAP